MGEIRQLFAHEYCDDVKGKDAFFLEIMREVRLKVVPSPHLDLFTIRERKEHLPARPFPNCRKSMDFHWSFPFLLCTKSLHLHSLPEIAGQVDSET